MPSMLYQNSFRKNSAMEAMAVNFIIEDTAPLMKNLGVGVSKITDLYEQLTLGDLRLENPEKGMTTITDVKVERLVSKNMFFETYSNKTGDHRERPGWGFEVQADQIWYWFKPVAAVAIIELEPLRAWLRGPSLRGRADRLHDFLERKQMMHEQMNLTVGRLIPFETIPRTAYRRCIRLDGAHSCITDRSFFDKQLVPRQSTTRWQG